MWRKHVAVILLVMLIAGHAYGVRLKPLRGRSIALGHPINRGLVGRWLMNEGSGNKVYDLSGNGYAMTLAGNAVFSPSTRGSVLRLDGAGDYAGRTFDGTERLPSTALSAVAWCRSVADNGYQTIMSIGAESGAYTHGVWFACDYNRSGYTRIYSYMDGPGANYGLVAGTPYDGTWHHIAITYNGVAVDYFWDGVQIDTDAASGNITYTGDDTYWCIGAVEQAGEFYQGDLDSVLLYDRALSPSEIAALYVNPYLGFVDTDLAMYVSSEEEPPATHTQVIMISAVPPILILTIVLMFAVEGYKKWE